MKSPLVMLSIFVLSGCATLDINDSLEQANREASAFTGGNLTLARSDEQRELLRATADGLLEQPLGPREVVQLALANSPSMQVLLAEHWERGAALASSGRIPNPIFAFERLESPNELEITRMLSVGLLDILTLPQRKRMAERAIDVEKLRLSADVVAEVTAVRQAWVRAVVAQQRVDYAEQVRKNADASSELARRMQEVGNFNRLARLRQQVFFVDAVTELGNAQHSAVAAREALVRALGLTESQADRLKLPERLPELPEAPQAAEAVAEAASVGRLDVRIAQASLRSVARSQGYEFLTGLTDIEVAGISESVFEDGGRETADGYELALELPIFSGYSALRHRLNARTLAAVNRLEQITREASSTLRESYSAYRTAFDVARHYRTEVVPLRQSISEEMQLEYNGMLIGVFELLADARSQVNTVVAAIDAEEQFWLADAALQATLIGQPTAATIDRVGGDVGGGAAEH